MKWKPDSQKVIRERTSTRRAVADVTSDLRLKLALQRRGLALDMALLLQFATHEKLIEVMMRSYLEDAPQGFSSLSLDQLRRADRLAFTLMAERTRGGIRPSGDERPLDRALEEVIDGPQFRMALLPLMGRSGKRSEKEKIKDGSRSRSPRRKSRAQRLAEKNRKLRDQAGHPPGGGGPGQRRDEDSGKGKGRGSRSPRMPAKLRGLQARTDAGEPICFAYNLDGCSLAKDGEKCPKGWHMKMRKKSGS